MFVEHTEVFSEVLIFTEHFLLGLLKLFLELLLFFSLALVLWESCLNSSNLQWNKRGNSAFYISLVCVQFLYETSKAYLHLPTVRSRNESSSHVLSLMNLVCVKATLTTVPSCMSACQMEIYL